MIKKLVYLVIVLSVVGVIAIGSIFLYFSFSLPKLTKLSDYNPPIPTKILSSGGEILAELRLQKRELVDIEKIPPVIIDAFTSAEDSNFFQHSGVDFVGIMRAMSANIKAGRIVQGGSTITQQVAKSLLLSSERSYVRKIKDFLLALKIEKHFSKKEILHLYLNQVYLGGGFYGVKTAFKGYFGIELKDVTIAQSAMLAGLLVAPGKYSPYLNPKRAKIRQEYVLGRLYANKKISETEYKDAMGTKLKFMLRKSHRFRAPYFTDWIIQKLIKRFGKSSLLRDGFTIKTSLDLKLQLNAEKDIQNGLRKIDKRQGYSGALKQIEKNDLFEIMQKERKKFLIKKSTFFTLSDLTKEKQYQFSENEELMTNYKMNDLQFLNLVHNKHFLKGNDSILDPIFDLIKINDFFKAYVLKVDRSLRIIYVSVMGIKGIIPYKYYNWAHERIIKDQRQYFYSIKNPNKIVKEGDQILVKIHKKNIKLKKYINEKFMNYYNKLPDKKKILIEKQSFLLLSLEQEPIVQGGLVSMDPFSGEIKALVGGFSFDKSKFNRALQSKRQPGSSFKPLLYAAALENGYTLASQLIDSPEALQGMSDGLSWKPKNYDGKFKGPITLRESLEHSRNVPTIKLASDIGIENILKFLKRIHFEAKVDHDLSLSLGTFGVTLKDIVKTYSIFPNGGKLIKEKSILSIVDRTGSSYATEEYIEKPQTEQAEQTDHLSDSPTPLEEDKSKMDSSSSDSEIVSKLNDSKVNLKSILDQKSENLKPPNPFVASLTDVQVYDQRLSYLMVNVLRGVIKNGTGRRARNVSPYIGGKTGTTNNYVDAWFIGFSSKLVTGVWTGMDDNKTLGWGETGSKAALPIWKSFMKYGKDYLGEHDFNIPKGIINVLIDKKTGRSATRNSEKSMMESFVDGTEPGANNEKYKEIRKDLNSSFEDELYYED